MDIYSQWLRLDYLQVKIGPAVHYCLIVVRSDWGGLLRYFQKYKQPRKEKYSIFPIIDNFDGLRVTRDQN